MSSSRSVLLIHPSLQPPGGGNGVAAWMAQALQDRCRLSVLTFRPVMPERVDRYFGTRLAEARVDWRAVPARMRRVADFIPFRHALLETSLLLRWSRPLSRAFDVVIYAQSEADLGRRGIQYVHFPWTCHPWPDVSPFWYRPAPRVLVAAYERACAWIAGATTEGMADNLTLVNSDWTGHLVARLLGPPSRTLYPPASGEFPEVAWEDREEGFVCVGRLAQDKRLEEVAAILADVRDLGHDIHLHLVGSRDDPGYTRRIRGLAGRHRDWISLHEDLSREELSTLMAHQRYGIHGMLEEHFGMAVAEMVSAGCLVFVPGGGGQVEILGGQEALFYRSRGDAVAKIVRVLDSPGEQQRLREYLASRRQMFSAARFVEQFRLIVEEWV